jgi:hypothetical protein
MATVTEVGEDEVPLSDIAFEQLPMFPWLDSRHISVGISFTGFLVFQLTLAIAVVFTPPLINKASFEYPILHDSSPLETRIALVVENLTRGHRLLRIEGSVYRFSEGQPVQVPISINRSVVLQSGESAVGRFDDFGSGPVVDFPKADRLSLPISFLVVDVLSFDSLYLNLTLT